MAESDTAEPWLPDWFWDEPPPKPPSFRHLAKWSSFADITGGFSPYKVANLYGGNTIKYPGQFIDPMLLGGTTQGIHQPWSDSYIRRTRTPDSHDTALGAPTLDTMGTELLAGNLSQLDYRALEARIVAALDPEVAATLIGDIKRDKDP